MNPNRIQLEEMQRITRDIDELFLERGKLVEATFPVGSEVEFVSHGMTVEAKIMESGVDGLRLLQSNLKHLPVGLIFLRDPWAEHYQLMLK